MSDVRSAIPDAEAYFSDSTDQSYTGMTAQKLHDSYDSGLAVSDGTSTGIVIAGPKTGDASQYCISAVDGGHWAHVVGPGGQVTNDGTASTNPCG